MANNNWNASITQRLARPLLYTLLVTAVLVGISMLLTAITSFAKPHVSTVKLYAFSEWIGEVWLWTLVVGVPGIGLLKLLSERVAQIRTHLQRVSHGTPVWLKVGLGICMPLLLLTAIQGFRNVHPEGALWISTGHAGPWAVSEPVARTYLWLSIRASSLTALVVILIVIEATQLILAALSTMPEEAA